MDTCSGQYQTTGSGPMDIVPNLVLSTWTVLATSPVYLALLTISTSRQGFCAAM